MTTSTLMCAHGDSKMSRPCSRVIWHDPATPSAGSPQALPPTVHFASELPRPPLATVVALPPRPVVLSLVAHPAAAPAAGTGSHA